MKIQLYPSLQFGWDIPQFKTVVGEYLNEEDSQKTEEAEQAKEQPELEPEDFEEEEL